MVGKKSFGDSRPGKLVSLGMFYMCRFPVSQRLWEEVMGENPSWFQDPQRPVEKISWDLINTQFLPALREKTGIEEYCLPTETQWEYAACGGQKGTLIKRKGLVFSGSDEVNEVGWYSQNTFEEPQAIGLKRPNSLGLYDMSGNVSEWCQDVVQISNRRILDPMEGDQRYVVQGGSWVREKDNSAIGFRLFNNSQLINYNIGFRLCRTSLL